jgi:hypothetical protein
MSRELNDKHTLHELKRHLSAESAEFLERDVAPHFKLDERGKNKLTAAHMLALSNGRVPDTKEYFQDIREFIGLPGGTRHVRVLAEGKRADPRDDNTLTAGEFKAANEVICWGREGGDRCGQPIGTKEFLRRRDAMRKTPGWFDKLD